LYFLIQKEIACTLALYCLLGEGAFQALEGWMWVKAETRPGSFILSSSVGLTRRLKVVYFFPQCILKWVLVVRNTEILS
jgi:hypothetical protein